MWFKIKLNDDSYIKKNNSIPENIKLTDDKFKLLWDLRPDNKPIIKIYGKDITCPRYFQNYGIDYIFSNVKHNSKPIPDILQPYLEYVNTIENKTYNNILVNWYEDNSNYIGYHADNEKQLIKESNIYCFSFGDSRDFYLKHNVNKTVNKYTLNNNSCIVMGGKCQQYYKHSIPKTKKIINKRISITLRQFETT